MNSRTDTTGRGAPTLRDVARRANVSTATVSRCLNMPDRVVDQTRDRVMQAVHDLGYSPNFGARVLAAKRTNTIGAIIPTMENAIFARGLQAFQEELQLHKMTLLVACSSYRADLEEEQIRALTARGADGLLLIGYRRGQQVYGFLHQQRMPFLIAWAFDPLLPYPAIGFDNRGAMLALARQVIAAGHRRIAVITAPRATNDRSSERATGICAALAEAGLDPETARILETPYGIDTGAAAFRHLMTGSARPTAIMCGNDVLAVGAMRMARQMGLQVPRDVSITGFDDIELASLTDPALTTVHVPHREMGRLAAQRLVRMVGSTNPEPNLELQTRLCHRGTLGPPPAGTGRPAV